VQTRGSDRNVPPVTDWLLHAPPPPGVAEPAGVVGQAAIALPTPAKPNTASASAFIVNDFI